MAATGRLDTALRGLILDRYAEFETRLELQLTRDFIAHLVDTWRSSGQLLKPVRRCANRSAGRKAFREGRAVARRGSRPGRRKPVNSAGRRERSIKKRSSICANPKLMDLPRGPIGTAWSSITEQLGVEPQTLFTSMQEFIQHRREQAWSEMAGKLDYEVFDQAVGAFDWYCIEELRKSAAERTTAAHPARRPSPPSQRSDWCAGRRATPTRSVSEGTRDKSPSKPRPQTAELHSLRADLDKRFGRGLLLWQKSKEDFVKEMDSTIQVPGWSNIFTQPIINRIDMLATGVRTMIGVKVFGNDLDADPNGLAAGGGCLAEPCPAPCRRVPDQIVGKGYLEITIDREQGGPLRRQRRRRAGCDRGGAGRQADHDDRRRPRATSGPNSLRRDTPAPTKSRSRIC